MVRNTLLRGLCAGALLFAASASPHAGGDPATPLLKLAQDEPHLPGASPVIGELHRNAEGQIEVIDPTKTEGKSARACGKGTICVGQNQAYPTIAAALEVARDGDTVEIVPGTYRESVTVVRPNITIRGLSGRPHLDCQGVALAEGKGCILLKADGATIENLEISGAQVPDAAGANGACIRNNGGAEQGFTVRDVICHGSQEGILSDGGKILIENSEFFDNSWNDRTHNVYLSGQCTAIVRGSTFRDARIGHEFKSRCSRTEISDSTFISDKGSRNIDIPDGGDTLVYRSRLVKTAGAQNYDIVGFAAESCAHPGDMTLKDVRIENDQPEAKINNYGQCNGHPIVLENVTIKGQPVQEVGYVLHR